MTRSDIFLMQSRIDKMNKDELKEIVKILSKKIESVYQFIFKLEEYSNFKELTDLLKKSLL